MSIWLNGNHSYKLHPSLAAVHNLLQSLYGQLAIFDMLYEHYGCEFYIGLLSLSYLVVYTQNYNEHYKGQYISFTSKFCYRVAFTSHVCKNFKTLHYNLKSSLYCKD